MDTQCLPSSSSSSSSFSYPKGHRLAKLSPSYSLSSRDHQHNTTICLKLRIHLQKEKKPCLTWKLPSATSKANNRSPTLAELRKDPIKKKGTISGAVALIIGTSIGSGILALPQKAAPAGIVPSSVSIIVCWGFLLVEALLLVEINVGLRMKKGKLEEENHELEIISITTMAQETLGEWGGNLATAAYVFLGYTSMVAYISKSGEILFHLINFPAQISGFFFTSLFTILISIGGTRATDQVNQWLTASMLCILAAIEVVGVVLGGWSGMEGSEDWGKVPATIPVIIFSLVYHDMAPVICAYLGSDLRRIRTSVLIGSLVPLVALLLWDAITLRLSLSSQADQSVDPVELLKSLDWSGVPFMVEAFSLLAVGTSIIGTLLSFSQFFKEQLDNLSWNSPSTQIQQLLQRKWWRRNNNSFTAMAMVAAPTLLVSTTVPDAFSAATDIAGGYFMTMLYGVLPPAMAWAMLHCRESEDNNQKELSRTKPALLVLGLFACGIVMEQLFQDLSLLHLHSKD